jgi:hypothetical protein
MRATIMSLPSVDLPAEYTFTRSEAASSVWK